MSAHRNRIAWFTPFSRKSSIGQFSATVLAELAKNGPITVFASDLRSKKDAWVPDWDVRPLSLLSDSRLARELDPFETLIYNLGDHAPFHQRIYEIALRKPGIVILHDLVLHHLIAGYMLHTLHDPAAYLRALEYAHGPAGVEFGRTIIDGSALETLNSPLMLNFNLAKAALHGALGVVVHSRFARQALEGFASYPVRHIDFPSPDYRHEATNPRPVSDKIRLLTYGVINPNKKVDEVLTTIGTSPLLRETARYTVIGSVAPDYLDRLKRIIAEQRLENQVELLGYQPDSVLNEHLNAADVLINLRDPHFGEASWSLMEAVWLGKPTIVWKHGYYDEFPDDVVAKISGGAELRPILECLCADDAMRHDLGKRAADYARQTFSTARYAEQLTGFIREVQYHRPALELADFAAGLLREINADDQSGVIETLAKEISSLTT